MVFDLHIYAVTNYRFQVSGVGFWVSGVRFRVSDKASKRIRELRNSGIRELKKEKLICEPNF
jgi:hypothetical protein